MLSGFEKAQRRKEDLGNQPRLLFETEDISELYSKKYKSTLQAASLQYVLQMQTEGLSSGGERTADIVYLNGYGRDVDKINQLTHALREFVVREILRCQSFQTMYHIASSNDKGSIEEKTFCNMYEMLLLTNQNLSLLKTAYSVEKSFRYFLALSRKDSDYVELSKRQTYARHVDKGVGKLFIKMPLLSICAYLLHGEQASMMNVNGMILTSPNLRPLNFARKEGDCVIVDCSATSITRHLHFCIGKDLEQQNPVSLLLGTKINDDVVPKIKFENIASIKTTRLALVGRRAYSYQARTFSVSLALNFIDVNTLLSCTDISMSGTTIDSRLFTINRGSLYVKKGYMHFNNTPNEFINIVITIYDTVSDLIGSLCTDAMRLSTMIGSQVSRMYELNEKEDQQINVVVNGPESEIVTNGYVVSQAFMKDIEDDFMSVMNDNVISLCAAWRYTEVIKSFYDSTKMNMLIAFVQGSAFINNVNQSVNDSRETIELYIDAMRDHEANMSEIAFIMEQLCNVSGVSSGYIVTSILDSSSSTEDKLKAMADANLGVGNEQLQSYVLGFSKLAIHPEFVRNMLREHVLKTYFALFIFCMRNFYFNNGRLASVSSDEAQELFFPIKEDELEMKMKEISNRLSSAYGHLYNEPLLGSDRGVHSRDQKSALARMGMPFFVDGTHPSDFSILLPPFHSVHAIIPSADTLNNPQYVGPIFGRDGTEYAIFKNNEEVIRHFEASIQDGMESIEASEVSSSAHENEVPIRAAGARLKKELGGEKLTDLVAKLNNPNGIPLYHILNLSYEDSDSFIEESNKVISNVGTASALMTIDLPATGGSLVSTNEIKYFSSTDNDENAERFIIAIRGTKDSSDMVLDANLIASLVDKNRVNNLRSERLYGPQQAYNTLKENFPDSQIIVVGHSLGGYIAGEMELKRGDVAISYNKLALKMRTNKREIALRVKNDITSLPVKYDSITYEARHGKIYMPKTTFDPIFTALNAHSINSLENVKFNL